MGHCIKLVCLDVLTSYMANKMPTEFHKLRSGGGSGDNSLLIQEVGIKSPEACARRPAPYNILHSMLTNTPSEIPNLKRWKRSLRQCTERTGR